MKCISLWQPWASLLVAGVKKIETRSWLTGYRGPLYIHAAKKHDKDDLDLLRYFNTVGLKQPESIPFGAIVGRVDLVDCKPTETIRDTISSVEYALGGFGNNRYGWITEKPVEFAQPVPFKGKQGLFEVNLTCEDCGKPGEITHCPYDADVYDTLTTVIACDECLNRRAEDI